MGKTIVVHNLNDCCFMEEPAEKLIVQSTKGIDEDFNFHVLRKLEGLREIQINDSENVFSSGDMIFYRSEKGVILKLSLGVEKHVIIPDGVNIIGCSAFYGTMIESVTFPESVTEISNRAFMNCRSLTKVEFSNGLRKIGTYSFQGCMNLKSLNIPRSVSEISKQAFSYNTSLTDVTLPDGLQTLEEHTFQGCKSLRTIIIPKTVKKIGCGAFAECDSLSEIRLPDQLIRIGDLAFHGCSSLKSIHLPKNLQKIGRQSFHGCGHLKSVDIPPSVKHIEPGAFSDCNTLTQANFHEGLQSIEQFAFRGCKLKEVSLPASVHMLGVQSLAGTELIHVKGYIPSLIEAAAFEKNSFCIDCGMEKIVIPGQITHPTVKKIQAVYETVMREQESSTVVHSLFRLGSTGRAKHLAALRSYKLSKDQEVREYLKRNGSNMLYYVQSEEEMMDLLKVLSDVGITGSVTKKGLAIAEEQGWTCATAYLLEQSEKIKKSSFSL